LFSLVDRFHQKEFCKILTRKLIDLLSIIVDLICEKERLKS